MRYKATLDSTATLITRSITFLFAFLIVGKYSIFPEELNLGSALSSTIFLLTVYVGVVLFRPLSFSLTPTDLVIHRPISSIKISRADILDAKQVDVSDMGFTIRTFASGGMFGYFGKLWSSKIGSVNYYATNRYNLILIVTKDKRKLVITPDDSNRFISELTETSDTSQEPGMG